MSEPGNMTRLADGPSALTVGPPLRDEITAALEGYANACLSAHSPGSARAAAEEPAS